MSHGKKGATGFNTESFSFPCIYIGESVKGAMLHKYRTWISKFFSSFTLPRASIIHSSFKSLPQTIFCSTLIFPLAKLAKCEFTLTL